MLLLSKEALAFHSLWLILLNSHDMYTVAHINFEVVEDYERWQHFIYARSDTHCSDLAQWRLIFKELYGFENYSYGYIENNDLVGAFSLYHISSPFLGNMLVTPPFFGRGGFYADTDKVRTILLKKIHEIASELNVDYVELRLVKQLPHPYRCNTDFLEFDLQLSGSPDDVKQRSLSSNVKQNISKSQKNNLQTVFSSDYLSCYKILSRTLRDLGTPFHGKRFFKTLTKYMKENTLFSEVLLNGKVVASGIVIRFKDSIITPYIGNLKEFRNSGSNYCQYWGIIQYCLKNSIKRFEFGRSPKNTTHVRFKEKWGTSRIQVYYNYYLINPKKKYKTVSHPSPLFLVAAMIWKKLPLFFTKIVGPLIFRYIP